MNVFVATADPTVDCMGEIVDFGYVVGVYSTKCLAKTAIIEDPSNRKDYEYQIEKRELNI